MISKMFKLFVLIMVFTVLSSGCSQPNSKQSNEGSEFSTAPLTITLAHGTGVGGTWHAVAEGLAEILRESYPGSRISVIPGSSDGNLARLQKDEIELAISTTDSANTAINGWESFDAAIPLDDVKAIACLYYSRVQFFVLSSTGINSIEDIKAKEYPLKISMGPRGSGMELGARRVLGEYGITYADIENWGGSVIFVGSSDSARMMGDGQLNAYFGLGAVPLSPFTELSLKRDFTVLPISDDVIEKMISTFDYSPGIIPNNAYKGLDKDIPTISVASGLYAANNLDEETAYLVTRALLNNMDKLELIHSQLKNLTPQFMNQNLIFPFHPGAQRAFQE